jgi:hypothetical protein
MCNINDFNAAKQERTSYVQPWVRLVLAPVISLFGVAHGGFGIRMPSPTTEGTLWVFRNHLHTSKLTKIATPNAANKHVIKIYEFATL